MVLLLLNLFIQLATALGAFCTYCCCYLPSLRALHLVVYPVAFITALLYFALPISSMLSFCCAVLCCAGFSWPALARLGGELIWSTSGMATALVVLLRSWLAGWWLLHYTALHYLYTALITCISQGYQVRALTNYTTVQYLLRFSQRGSNSSTVVRFAR